MNERRHFSSPSKYTHTMKPTLLTLLVALPLAAQESAPQQSSTARPQGYHKVIIDYSGSAQQKKALEQFDVDKDGKLNAEEEAARKAAEKEAWRKCMLDKYDTNKDGTLDEAETAAMRKDMEQQHEVKIVSPARKLSPEEMKARLAARKINFEQEVLEQWDTDKDGKLSDEERAAMESAISSPQGIPPRRIIIPAPQDSTTE